MGNKKRIKTYEISLNQDSYFFLLLAPFMLTHTHIIICTHTHTFTQTQSKDGFFALLANTQY